MSALAKNYNRRKISFKYGKGSFLYSTNGKKYLDFVQGIAVNSLGHANPYLVKAVSKQSRKLWHVSNAFIIPEGEKLAKRLAKKNKLKINYICASPETLKIKKKFDVILNMEIVEHVNDIDFFIKESSKLLKKNGIMFIATLNKTLKSYVFAIVGAEYILKWLPIGTHDWEKFVKPSELISITKKNSLYLKKLDGMNFNILDNSWKVTNDTSVNYITKFIKN